MHWSQTELAARAAVNLSTVCDFEKGKRRPMNKNLAAIVQAFNDAGIVFPEDTAEFTNAVGVKPGVDVSRKVTAKNAGTAGEAKESGNGAAAWDSETCDSAIAYWREGTRWTRLTDTSRALISSRLFGRPDAGDEVFGAAARDGDGRTC